jgi:hypothetical protein
MVSESHLRGVYTGDSRPTQWRRRVKAANLEKHVADLNLPTIESMFSHAKKRKCRQSPSPEIVEGFVAELTQLVDKLSLGGDGLFSAAVHDEDVIDDDEAQGVDDIEGSSH